METGGGTSAPAPPDPPPDGVAEAHPDVLAVADSEAPAVREPLTIPAFADLADLEQFLRQHGKFSRREALAIVVEAKAVIFRKAPAAETARSIVDALNRRTDLIRDAPLAPGGVP